MMKMFFVLLHLAGCRQIFKAVRDSFKTEPYCAVAEQTVDKLRQTIGQIMDQFHADECLNVFNNSGYISN